MRIAVVVPAHDEAALLPGCLAALRCAAERVAPVPVRPIVVADACRDGTAAIAEAGGAAVVPVEERNVGAARAAGVAFALAETRSGLDGLWVASTDADSLVRPDWLCWQLRHAAAEADLVAGTVVVDDWSGWPGPVPSRYERRYRSGVAGRRHRHVHGANLGFRANVYLAAGGFPPVTHDEDRGLIARVRSIGGRVVTDARCPVRTSARADGRAPHGFAAHLGSLAAGN